MIKYKGGKLTIDLTALPTYEELIIKVKPFEPRNGMNSGARPTVYVEFKTNIGWLENEN